MALTATKTQTAILLNVSEDTVENLLHQERLKRIAGNRFVHITLQSIAQYTSVPLELVVQELRYMRGNAPAATKIPPFRQVAV